jgi:hypothetical protein
MALGFAAAYMFPAGSRAATAATSTTPKPDPPPTTTTRVVQPPPAPVPPPPPRPAQTYVAPPPPAARSRSRVKARKVAAKRRIVRAKRRTGSFPTKVPPRRPPRDREQTREAAFSGPIAPSSRGASSHLVLLLGLALGLSVLLGAAGLAPANALPQPASYWLDRRRQVLIGASAAIAVGIAVGIVVGLILVALS